MPVSAALRARLESHTQLALAPLTKLARVNPQTLGSQTPADYRFRYIDISAVERGTVDWDAVGEVEFGAAPSRARRCLRNGDSMLCTVRPGLQSHGYAEIPQTEPYVCSTGFAVLRPKVPADARYLFHLLFSETVSRQLHAWEMGTGYPAVNENEVARLLLPMASAEDRAAIARILDAADEATARTRTTLQNARRVKRALMQQLLTRGTRADRQMNASRFGRFPVGWTIRKLGEVADVGSGVTLGKDLSGYATVELPYLRVANVQDGHLDLTEIKTIRVKRGEAAQYMLQSGDVLMTEGGDLDKLGRGTVWNGEIKNCLHQNHVFRVRANRQHLIPDYLAAVIGAEYGKRYFMRVAKRTTNLASTNKTQVRAFPLPLPPVDEQQHIVAIIAAAERRVAAEDERLRRLERLKRGLMQDLLTGRKRVPLYGNAELVG